MASPVSGKNKITALHELEVSLETNALVTPTRESTSSITAKSMGGAGVISSTKTETPVNPMVRKGPSVTR